MKVFWSIQHFLNTSDPDLKVRLRSTPITTHVNSAQLCSRQSSRSNCFNICSHPNLMPNFDRLSTSMSLVINQSFRSTAMIVVLFLAISSPGLTSGQMSQTNFRQFDIGKLFSLKQLIDYNDLMECMTKMNAEFSKCNTNALDKGEAVLKFIPGNTEIDTLLRCCGIWDISNCWANSAKKYCKREQIEQVKNLPHQFIEGLKEACHRYPPDSFVCYTPYLAVAGGVICVVALIIGLVFLTVFLCRRRRRNHLREDRKHLEPGAISVKIQQGDDDGDKSSEKMKLTSSSKQSDCGSSNGSSGNGKNNNFIDSKKG